MTIFFSKRTGNIQAVFSGNLQHIATVCGTNAIDYLQIWDEIEIPDDEDVMNSFTNYHVNTDTKQLEIFPSANPYPIAQI